MKYFIPLLVILTAGCTETGNQRKDQVGETVVGQSMARAKDSVCQNNLSQIRQAIMIAKTSGEESLPNQLSEYRGLGRDMLNCPIGKEAYAYDPGAGTVKCPHLGHEKY